MHYLVCVCVCARAHVCVRVKLNIGIDMKKWQLNFTHLKTSVKVSYTKSQLKCIGNSIIALILNKQSKNLNSLTCREFLNFEMHMCFISQSAIRPTSTRHMGPIFSHNKGNCGLIMNKKRLFSAP